MSVAATQASKFYEQVIAEGRVFTVDDGEGYLVFPIGEIEVVPFWSSRSVSYTHLTLPTILLV